MFTLTKKSSETKDFLFRTSEVSLTNCCQCSYGQSARKNLAQKNSRHACHLMFLYLQKVTWSLLILHMQILQVSWSIKNEYTTCTTCICCAQLNQAGEQLVRTITVRLMTLKKIQKYSTVAICGLHIQKYVWLSNLCVLSVQHMPPACKWGKTPGMYCILGRNHQRDTKVWSLWSQQLL